jgi:rubrerythrin
MKLLNEMLKDEKNAPKEYSLLYKKLKSLKDRKIILNIIRDEKRHHQLLINLNRRLKGG